MYLGPGALLVPSYQAAEEFKTEAGQHFKRGDYALNEGAPRQWKLRLVSTPGGTPDPHSVGAAVAALGKGFRGNKVSIPKDKLGQVKARVLRAWKAANPGYTLDDIPDVLTANDDVEGVAPPGWENTVKKMKKSGNIDNPFALAWYMKKRGMHPARHEHDAAYDAVLAHAHQELQGRQMPQICLDAAAGSSYAMTQCLQGGPFLLEARWH